MLAALSLRSVAHITLIMCSYCSLYSFCDRATHFLLFSRLYTLLFFSSYYFLAWYILLSLILAQITDEFRHIFSKSQFPTTDEDIKQLEASWTCLSETKTIPRWKLYALYEVSHTSFHFGDYFLLLNHATFCF